MVDETTAGIGSLSTRRPLGSTSLCIIGLSSLALTPRLVRLLLRHLFLGFAQREPNFPVASDLEHLDVDLVALMHDVFDRAHALVGKLRDVEQAVGAGHDFDE